MRRDYLIILVIFSFAVSITSCEVPIEIEGDTKLVVQSYFSDNQDLIVYVTESNLRSEKENPYVENAVVTLFSGDDFEFINTLVFVPHFTQSFYKTVDFNPIVGEVYMLSIEVPGYKPVTASTSIPLAVDLEEVAIGNTNTVVNDETGVSEIQFDISVTLNDPVEHENYYHLIFGQELISHRIGENGQPKTDTTLLNTDKNLFIECTTKSINVQQFKDYPSFILEDKKFNGENIQLNFTGHYSYDEKKYERGEFTIEMRTVSDAYYRHYLNLIDKPESGGYSLRFDGSYSNVTNGAGVFAGYTVNVTRVLN